MKKGALRISAVALLAGPTIVAFFSGAFFAEPRLWAALGAWVIAGVVAALAPRPLPESRSGRIAVGALALLTVWAALSLLWAPLRGPGFADVQRLSLYLAGLIGAAALLREPAAARAVEPALVAGALAQALFALSERLLPSVVDLTSSASAMGRLEQPLTYWNAQGSVLAVGLVLAIRLAGAAERRPALRLGAIAAAPWLAAGVYLALSRGALAALAVGVIVLLVIVRERLQQRVAAIALGAGAVAALGAGLLDGVQSGEAGTGEGAAMLALLVALSAASALASVRLRRMRGVLAAAGVAAVLVVTAAIFVGGAEAPAERSGSPTVGAERLRSLGSNRYEYWQVALNMVGAHPVQGEGSGSFGVAWLRERDIEENVRDAHSLALETAGELGLVGLTLLVALFAAVAVAARRAVRVSPLLGPGAAAGLAAWGFHAQIDWLSELPASALVAILLAGLVIALREEGSPARGLADSGLGSDTA